MNHSQVNCVLESAVGCKVLDSCIGRVFAMQQDGLLRGMSFRPKKLSKPASSDLDVAKLKNG